MNNSNDPIRVLCVFASLNRGGAESMCMNLYRCIDRSKVQFDFVKHTSAVGSFEDEIISLGGRIFTAPAYRIANFYSYQKWWKQHLSEHPEHSIIHGHFFTISPVYFSAAKKMGRITIGHSHSSQYTKRDIKTLLKIQILKSIERYSDCCFACGLQAGQWLFPHKRFTVLNNAIDTSKFLYSNEIRKKKRDEFGINNELVICTVGRITYQKNPSGIVNIFDAVLNQNPSAKLLWVGDGNLRPQAERELKEKGIIDNVIFTGVRSDVNELLQAADVFILPSLWEGLPVCTIEAQAAGLPCFLSNRITDEVNITGLCSFLPVDDYKLWAEKIINTDYSNRCDTSQKIVDAGYDIKTTAAWLQDFYLTLSDR